MSSTPPITSGSTPSPCSTPPIKALTQPTSSPRNDTPTTSQNLQLPGARLEPSRTKPSSLNVETDQSTTKPHHHIPHRPHHPHRHREPLKTVQAALLPSTAFGEILSPVKSTAGGFAVRGSGREERQGRAARKKSERDERGLDPALRGTDTRVIKETTWADVTRQKERRIKGEK